MILTTRKIDNDCLEEIPVFTDIEPELLNFSDKCRVLPAPFYEEPLLNFELIKRYEPGENKYFPNGGFEIYGPGHERRSFDLDQVVVHPFSLNKMGYFKKTDNLVVKNKITDPNKPKGKRGRPKKLDENGNVLIIQREYVPTGGKRGRPKKLDENGNPIIKEKKEYIPTGGKRGRKALTEEEKAKRELEKQNKTKTTGGKRGRPSTLTAEEKEEKRLIEEEKNRLRSLGLLRRGRPSFK